MKAVVEGLKTLTNNDVPDMYDPAFVESGSKSPRTALRIRLRESKRRATEFQPFQRKLVNRLIESKCAPTSRNEPHTKR